jgi:ATP synthase protein I
MPSVPRHSGEMSQNSGHGIAHPTTVQADAEPAKRLTPAVDRFIDRPIDPAARASRRMYEGLSASSVGLEMGLSVVVALLFGMWLDGKLGTQPWLMLVFLLLGLFAGFRNLMRAVARAERAEKAAERADRG